MRKLIGLCAIALMSACGGGNGGDDVAANVNVTVGLTTVPSIQATVATGRSIADLTLSAKVTGELPALNGKTIYVVLEDPSNLFQAATSLSGPNAQGDMQIVLTGKPLNTVGDLSGNVTVHACLDLGCNTELRGSPVQIPYQVAVRPGLALSQTSFDVSAIFGEPAFTRTLTASPLNRLKGFSMGTSIPGVKLDAPTLFTQSSTPHLLTLTFHPQAPGTVVKDYPIEVEFEHTDGSTYRLIENISIRHVTTDNPTVDYVFPTRSLNLDARQANSAIANFWVVTRPGVTMTATGVEYLSHPVAANGNALASNWLRPFADIYLADT
ncbi:MAG: hypothetical protein RLZZ618_2769, partial [Pseudomonadota bacterium]